MQENKPITINPLMIGLVIIQIIFVVFIVISFQNLFRTEVIKPEMKVNGLVDEISGLPVNGKQAIENTIYKAVASNSVSNNIEKSAVDIREGTMISDYLEKADVHYVNFIADLPEIRQSYRVYYEWSDDSANRYISPDYSAVVFCLDENELIYGEFNCNLNNEYMKNTIIANMVSRVGNIIPGVEGARATPENATNGAGFRVKINYYACESQCYCVEADQMKKEEALKGFSDFVDAVGFAPKDVEYYFYNCENEWAL